MMMLPLVLVLCMMILTVLIQVIEARVAPVELPVQELEAPGWEPIAPGAPMYEGLADRPSFVMPPPVYRGRCWTDQLGLVDRYWVMGPGEVLLPVLM